MSNTNTGGPAFPSAIEALAVSRGVGGGADYKMRLEGGMTIRDYFAAQAMSGLVVNGDNFDLPKLAAYSYQMADAMLKAREA